MKELFTLGKLNASDFIPMKEDVRKKYELKLMLEEETGAVRLEKPAPLDAMYGKYWYRSGINQTMKDELKNVVESITKVHKLKENDIWLDIACFTEGNFVNTSKGNIDIKNIKIGDRVLSHDGEYHKVIKKFKRIFEGDFIRLKLRGLNLNTIVTHNHEFLTDNGWVKAENLLVGSKLKLGTNYKKSNIKYLDLYKMLKKSHKFDVKDMGDGFIISVSNGLKNKLPKLLKIDNDFARIIGYYIGEGSESGGTGIQFAFGQKELQKALQVEKYFIEKFNIKTEIIKYDTRIVARVNSRLLSTIFRYLCGHKAFDKKIPRQIINENFISTFLHSLWFTDGHFSLHKTKYGKYRKNYIFSTVSKKLIIDLWEILKSYNIHGSVQCVRNDRGFSVKDGSIYRLTVERNSSVDKLENIFNNIKIKNDDTIDEYLTIIDIKKTKEKHIVYNMEVEDTNTYVCNGVVVHNCNDGTMFDYMPENIIKIGVDPCDDSYKKESEKRADVIIQDYFSYNVYKKCKFGKMKAKIITIIAMFYDLDKPDPFLQDIYKILDEDGLFVMQMSYTPLMLKQLAFDNICHEHIYYYSLFNIKKILERNGFSVVDCTLDDINGGSFRVFMKKKGMEEKFHTRPYRDVANFRVDSLLEYEKTLKLDEKETWNDFFNRINNLKEQTVNFIKEVKKQGKTVWGYGASTKGNTTLQYFGLDNTLIDGIAERSTYKWGLKTSGTNIPIYSEEEMRQAKPDYLLILPWHFINVFKEREKDYLIGGGKFIVPCPKFEVVEY